MKRSAPGYGLLCQHHADLLVFDTHCHLERFRRPSDVLQRARAAGVGIVAVTSRPSDFRTLFPLYGRRDGVRLALGIHPLEIGHMNVSAELELFAGYAPHTSYIGEIGLDLSPEGRPTREAQEEAFVKVLETPGVADKLLTVHSRRASRQTIEHLVGARACRVIMHWFSGPTRDLDMALNAGFRFSINPAMTRSKKGLSTIATLPRECVLLESDGPYVRVGSREAEPIDVLRVVDCLSEVWGVAFDEVLSQLRANLNALLEGIQAPNTA